VKKIPIKWKKILEEETKKDYFQKIVSFLEAEKKA
jgi:uracil DNA glycosylase